MTDVDKLAQEMRVRIDNRTACRTTDILTLLSDRDRLAREVDDAKIENAAIADRLADNHAEYIRTVDCLNSETERAALLTTRLTEAERDLALAHRNTSRACLIAFDRLYTHSERIPDVRAALVAICLSPTPMPPPPTEGLHSDSGSWRTTYPTPEEPISLNALTDLLARALEHVRNGTDNPELADEIEAALSGQTSEVPAPPKPKGVYGEWCRDPFACSPLGYCPRDPTCCD